MFITNHYKFRYIEKPPMYTIKSHVAADWVGFDVS
jgi:hypothetical protein